MENKMVALLQSMNTNELLRFKKYLHSPIVNEEPMYTRLYGNLLPVIKRRELHLLEREKAGAGIFAKKKITNQDYARLFSNFSRKIEQFLVFEKNRKNTTGNLIALLEILNERELVKYFPELLSYSKKIHAQNRLIDGEYYLQQFAIDAQQNMYLEIRQQRTNDKNLAQTLQSLDAYYIINKLRYCAAMLHYKSFLSMQGEVHLLTEILAYLDKHDFGQVPLIAVYRRIISCFTQFEDETHYTELLRLIALHQSRISQSVLKDIYAFAMIYCISMINFGKTEYERKLFELYKQSLQLKLMFKKGELSPWDFKNIVTVALRTGENKWAFEFIRGYKNSIPELQRQNAYTFNLARYYFFEKKFDKVLVLLQDVKYDDIFYQLDSKTTLMKTYYELGEYLPLMALKESFRILLRRKKLISAQNRINYMNFIRFTMKLYRVDVKNNKKLAGITKQITESTNVADKGWLEEKLRELGSAV